MLRSRSIFRVLMVIGLAATVGACGGGGGGSSKSGAPTGSLQISDVDIDDNGLIEIATLQQLDWMRNDLAGKSLTDNTGQVNSKGCPPGGCRGYELVADLNFDTNGDGVLDRGDTYFDYDHNGSNAGWLPIGFNGEYQGGTAATPHPPNVRDPHFAAIFDGNGHRISNLYINRSNNNVGLFASVLSTQAVPTSIRNLTLDGALMSITGAGAAGSLIGFAVVDGPLLVDNCRSAGVAMGGLVGGLIGVAEVITPSGTFTLQNSNASTVVSGVLAGGLLGEAMIYDGGNILLAGNSASGAASAASSAVESAGGGLVGMLYAAGVSTLTLDHNYATGAVTRATSYDNQRDLGGGAGGLVGAATTSVGANIFIKNSYATNSVGGPQVGGLIANIDNDGTTTIDNCYATGAVFGSNVLGGLVGTSSVLNGLLTIQNSYSSATLYAAVNVTKPATIRGTAGGLVGGVTVYNNGVLSIRNDYASGGISGGTSVGGLVGELRAVDAAAISVENTFSSGAVMAFYNLGGLVGNVSTSDTATIDLINNFAVGAITDQRIYPIASAGGLTGLFNAGGSTASFNYNYWAVDATGIANSVYGPLAGVVSSGVVGAQLAELQCPIAANNSSCAASELYHDWNLAVDGDGNQLWDFGSTAQLPGLRIGDTIHRPVYNNGSFTIVKEPL